jgi:hypothetical protein
MNVSKRKYTYYPNTTEPNANDYLAWCVHETATEQIIDTFFFMDDAQEYCQFLEAGGAFDGFTPSFVIKKTQLTDINAAFAIEFGEAAQ